jgi:hypothetical protein
MSNPQTGPDAYQRQMTMVEIDHGLVVRLRPEAARRDMPVTSLIHDLLDVIANRRNPSGIGTSSHCGALTFN